MWKNDSEHPTVHVGGGGDASLLGDQPLCTRIREAVPALIVASVLILLVLVLVLIKMDKIKSLKVSLVLVKVFEVTIYITSK